MFSKDIPVEAYFTYHPATNQDRIDKHNRVNNAAKEFALAIQDVFEGVEFREAIKQIQIIRMMANQNITIKDVYLDG